MAISKAELETLPGWEMTYLCRSLAKMVEKYFEDPEVQKEFEEWEKEYYKRPEVIRSMQKEGA